MWGRDRSEGSSGDSGQRRQRIYIAGQTAPGDGITLINYDFGGMGTSDLVIRDMRVRVGDMNGKSSGGMGLGSCNHSIVDHCSISWATDEGFPWNKAIPSPGSRC